MKVSELIEQLKQLPQDQMIFVDTNQDDISDPVIRSKQVARREIDGRTFWEEFNKFNSQQTGEKTAVVVGW